VEQRHGVLDAERVQVEGGITFAARRVEPDGDLVSTRRARRASASTRSRAAAVRAS
jgi:hypothetical protein